MKSHSINTICGGVATLVAAAAIAVSSEPTLYVIDGQPTGTEEEIRWLVNRGRSNGTAENAVYRTNHADIRNVKIWPLAPNKHLIAASRQHAEDLALTGLFQHATVPASKYFDSATTKSASHRAVANGYPFPWVYENLAGGHTTGERVHETLFNSAGHRSGTYQVQVMEIGVGVYVNARSRFQRYYGIGLADVITPADQRTADLEHFFTGSIFSDANRDGRYNDGEGISGVAVRLRIAGELHANYDVSESAGNFAVPILRIADKSSVQVYLQNTTGARVSLTVPTGHETDTTVALAAGEELLYGSYTQPEERINMGFRNVRAGEMGPPLAPKTRIDFTPGDTDFEFCWQGVAGFAYQVEFSRDGRSWSPLGDPILGTGEEARFPRDLPADASAVEFLRVSVTAQ